VPELTSQPAPLPSGPGAAAFDRDDLTPAEILDLDRLAAAAWPARMTEPLDGWQLRFADGVSRRANSCDPFPPIPDARPLDARIDAVEAFYRGHGLPPRFQMSPAAEPEGLDAVLAQRGYAVESGVAIQIAPAATIAALLPDEASALVAEQAPDGWWELYIEGYKRDGRAIVGRSRDKAAFGYLDDDDGNKIAIGLGVLGGRWLGIFGMLTRPALRGQGIGTRVLGALAQWAVAQGAVGLYLQVEDSNPDARRLYERLGFRSVYRYYYRTLWT